MIRKQLQPWRIPSQSSKYSKISAYIVPGLQNPRLNWKNTSLVFIGFPPPLHRLSGIHSPLERWTSNQVDNTRAPSPLERWAFTAWAVNTLKSRCRVLWLHRSSGLLHRLSGEPSLPVLPLCHLSARAVLLHRSSGDLPEWMSSTALSLLERSSSTAGAVNT